MSNLNILNDSNTKEINFNNDMSQNIDLSKDLGLEILDLDALDKIADVPSKPNLVVHNKGDSLNNLNTQRGGLRTRSYSTGSINMSRSPFSPDNYIVDKSNTLILPKVHRLIAIGDIHGDMRAIVRSLKIADVIPINTPEDNMNFRIGALPPEANKVYQIKKNRKSTHLTKKKKGLPTKHE